MATTPPAQKPPKPLAAWQKKLLQDLWDNALKPRVTAAAEAAKASLLKALEGKPLLTIGAAVGAVDAFLLTGPKPKSTKYTKFLGDAQTLLSKAQEAIDRLLAPPKPISAKLRKVLAGVVTIAGMLGMYQVGKTAPPTLPKV